MSEESKLSERIAVLETKADLTNKTIKAVLTHLEEHTTDQEHRLRKVEHHRAWLWGAFASMAAYFKFRPNF